MKIFIRIAIGIVGVIAIGYLFFRTSILVEKEQAEKISFIFEKDFRGRAIFIEGADTDTPTIVEGREQLFSSKEGIILYPKYLSEGWRNFEYYQKLSNGDLKKLPYCRWLDRENTSGINETDSIGIWIENTDMGHTTFLVSSLKNKNLYEKYSSSEVDSLIQSSGRKQ